MLFVKQKEYLFTTPPGVFTNGYSICVNPLYVLGNGGISECYTGSRSGRRFWQWTEGHCADSDGYNNRYTSLEKSHLFTGVKCKCEFKQFKYRV